MQQASNQEVSPQTDAFLHSEEGAESINLKPDTGVLLAAKPSKKSYAELRRARSRRRLLVGGGFSTLYMIALAVFSLAGAIDRTTLVCACLLVAGLSEGFYLIYIHSKNQRQAEKKLTGPIASCALAIMLYVAYAAPESRMIFIPFVFIAIAYGMYYLSRRSMLLLGAGTLAGYAAVIVSHHVQWHDAALLKSELLNWFVLMLTLPGFVLLAGRVRQLRGRGGLEQRGPEERGRENVSHPVGMPPA